MRDINKYIIIIIIIIISSIAYNVLVGYNFYKPYLNILDWHYFKYILVLLYSKEFAH